MAPLPPQEQGPENGGAACNNDSASYVYDGKGDAPKFGDCEAEEGSNGGGGGGVVESTTGGVVTKRHRRRKANGLLPSSSSSSSSLPFSPQKSSWRNGNGRVARGRTFYRSPLTWEYWVNLPTPLLLQIVAAVLLLLGLSSLALYQVHLLQQMHRETTTSGGHLSKNPYRTDKLPLAKRRKKNGGFMSRLGNMLTGGSSGPDEYGDFGYRYLNLKKEFDAKLPFDASNPEDLERVRTFVNEHVRERTYQVVDDEVGRDKEDYYDVHNCPFDPPPGYPRDYPILEVLKHWPPDDVKPRSHIHQGLCRFDFNTEREKALNYRRLEVPFVVRDDPSVLETVQRWNTDNYVKRLMGRVPHRTEYSDNNHFMYWLLPPSQYKKEKQKQKKERQERDAVRGKRRTWEVQENGQEQRRRRRRRLTQEDDASHHKSNGGFAEGDPDHYDSKHWHGVEEEEEEEGGARARANGARPRRNKIEPPPGWSAPTELSRMRYDEWLEHANVTSVGSDEPHWYYRLIGCGAMGKCDRDSSEYLFQELPFFYPEDNQLYIVEPERQKGIHCRFGMEGIIAENHFDGSRNAIVVLGGERRYLLSHPRHCENMVLFPKGHPSARHSAVDWSDPDLEQYPEFSMVRTNEVVLQAGDVLYLPTNWFHYIVSLGLNWQCNTRSGINNDYMDPIHECGF